MELSNDEIILQIRKENREAKELLFLYFEKHIAVIRKLVEKDFSYLGISREDLKYIIFAETLNVIKMYEFDKSVFFAFWKLWMIRYLRNRLKGSAHTSISGEKINLSLSDYPFENFYNKNNPLEEYILSDFYRDSLDKVDSFYGNIDKKILKLWSEGFSYEEISQRLNISLHKVTYSIYRSIKLLKENGSRK